MSDSVRPHRRQPTRLPRPWDSPGKNTGVGCQFLLQCMKVKSESEVAQSCPTLSDPMGCNLPGSFAHGIFQATVLEWGAIAFSDSCLENPINSMKRQKNRKTKDELPRSVGTWYSTRNQWRNNTVKNEESAPKEKQNLLVDVTGDRSKVQCGKGNNA